MDLRSVEEYCFDFNRANQFRFPFIAFCAPVDIMERTKYLTAYCNEYPTNWEPLTSGRYFREFFDCGKVGWDTDTLIKDGKEIKRNFDIYVLDRNSGHAANGSVYFDVLMTLGEYNKSKYAVKADKAMKHYHRNKE